MTLKACDHLGAGIKNTFGLLGRRILGGNQGSQGKASSPFYFSVVLKGIKLL